MGIFFVRAISLILLLDGVEEELLRVIGVFLLRVVRPSFDSHILKFETLKKIPADSLAKKHRTIK
jgi:hypothetical protein